MSADVLPWAAVALVAVAILAAIAYRRGGWPGVAAVVLGALSLGLLTRRRRVDVPERAPCTDELVDRERARIEERRQEAQEALLEAEVAREAADDRRAALEVEEDVDDLIAEGIRRSMGKA